jgi:hypothetical protein
MHPQMDQPQQLKPNWYVRTLIAVFCLLLTGMVGYRFAWIDPKGEISGGVVTLLCLLLVLVLAESFDNFSIGKLISISREAKKKEKQVDKLETQNAHLLSQLIAISNSQSQTQSHTNVYGDYLVAPTVRKASEEEVRDKQTTEAPIASVVAEAARTRMNWRKAEELGLKKYVQLRSIHPSNLIVDAKLVNQFQGIDPISNSQIIFDGYLKEQDHETFVELRPTFMSPLFRDRLYIMLSKINHYRSAKKVDAHLDLVLMKIPGEEARSGQTLERLLENFEPAIAGGLLRVVSVEFTDEEAAACRDAQ